MLILLGPTATGKTRTAVQLAARLQGEIISADSRQVFRGMDLGTGKDLQEYQLGEQLIRYHLIDIANPGEEYSVYRFQQDFIRAYDEIKGRNHFPILCGGTGLYLESVVKGYRMIGVPADEDLRARLNNKSMDELIAMLATYRKPHSTTDTCDRQRILRAIEIERYHRENPDAGHQLPVMKHLVAGLRIEREEIRKRITRRLEQRMNAGMVEEVRSLLDAGVPAERLLSYGLEYRFITEYILGNLGYEEMLSRLNTAIHQFAKRQMTWFRHMEKNGCTIHWIDGMQTEEQKVAEITGLLKDAGIIS